MAAEPSEQRPHLEQGQQISPASIIPIRQELSNTPAEELLYPADLVNEFIALADRRIDELTRQIVELTHQYRGDQIRIGRRDAKLGRYAERIAQLEQLVAQIAPAEDPERMQALETKNEQLREHDNKSTQRALVIEEENRHRRAQLERNQERTLGLVETQHGVDQNTIRGLEETAQETLSAATIEHLRSLLSTDAFNNVVVQAMFTRGARLETQLKEMTLRASGAEQRAGDLKEKLDAANQRQKDLRIALRQAQEALEELCATNTKHPDIEELTRKLIMTIKERDRLLAESRERNDSKQEPVKPISTERKWWENPEYHLTSKEQGVASVCRAPRDMYGACQRQGIEPMHLLNAFARVFMKGFLEEKQKAEREANEF